MPEKHETLDEIKKKWFRDRKWTTGIGIALKCLTYFEYFSITISGLYYYENSFNVSNPKFFYGCVMGSIFVSGVTSTYFCGRYMDKTRDLRKIIIYILICNIIGNLMFTMTYSPWLPVVGRFVCGISACSQVVFTGEFSRVYNKKELAKVLSLCELLGTIFGALAPCTPVLFYGVHFRIDEHWIITQYNFIGIFLAIISLALLVFAFLFLHNLTHDETFNKHLKYEIYSKEEEKKRNKIATDKLWNTKDIVAHRKLFLLLLTDAFLAFSYFQMDLVIVMVAVKTYHWTMFRLGLLTGGVMVFVTIFLYNVQKRLLGDGLNIFFLYVTGFAIIALYESFLLLILNLHLTSLYGQALAIFVLLSCNFIQGFGATVYCRWLMFSCSPSHSASIVESHRYIFNRIMATIAFFTSSYAFDVLWIVIPIYVSISFIIVAMYSIKRHEYITL